MADVKISALPLATTPLAGTEVLPIVQSATTDQVSVANLTAGRAVSAASLTLTTTPLAVGSGGTGLTSLTAGYIPYASSSSALSFSSNLFSDGTNISVGTTNTGLAKFTVYGTNAGSWLSSSATTLSGNSAKLGVYIDHQGSGATTYNGVAFRGQANYDMFFGRAAGASDDLIIARSNYATDVLFTFSAAGNVGIGTTSPGSKLDIVFTSNPPTDNGSGASAIRCYTEVTQAADVGGAIGLGGRYSTSATERVSFAQIAGRKENGTSGNLAGYLQICTLAAGGTMNEAARIDTSGNLLVGTTTTQQKLTVYSAGSGGTAFIYNTNALLGGNLVDIRADRNTTNGSYQYFACYNQTAAAYKMYVIDSGKIYSTDTAIGSLSDARHKENIRDIDKGLDAILALKPRRFDWKENKGSGKKNVAGFIAQEVEPVFPDLIDGWKDNETPDLKALSMGGMVPAIVKAIQELAAEVAELKAKVA